MSLSKPQRSFTLCYCVTVLLCYCVSMSFPVLSDPFSCTKWPI